METSLAQPGITTKEKNKSKKIDHSPAGPENPLSPKVNPLETQNEKHQVNELR